MNKEPSHINSNDEMFSEIEIPTLGDVEQQIGETQITLKELGESLKQMANNKWHRWPDD